MLPDPAEAPLTLVATAVQLYVVPVTPFGFVIAIDVDSPEQIVWSVAEALVTGRTVTTKFTGEPLQPPLVGVMVYITTPFEFVEFTGLSAIVAPDPDKFTPVKVPMMVAVQL